MEWLDSTLLQVCQPGDTVKPHTNLVRVWIRESKKDRYIEPVQDRGWHPRAELRVAIERVTDEVQGTHLLAYHLLVVEELQQVKVCDSHTKLVWEDGQSAQVMAADRKLYGWVTEATSGLPGNERPPGATCSRPVPF